MAGKGKMKMLPEHYAIVEKAVKPQMTVTVYLAYKSSDNCTFRRFIWDCWWKANKEDRTLGPWISSVLYPYLDDSHIETALRAVARAAGLSDYSK